MKKGWGDGDIEMRITSANKNSFIAMKGSTTRIFVQSLDRCRFFFRIELSKTLYIDQICSDFEGLRTR